MTGDTDASLLPVHVHESALQAAACRTEDLKKNKEKKDTICTTFIQRMSTLDEKSFYFKTFKGEELKIN